MSGDPAPTVEDTGSPRSSADRPHTLFLLLVISTLGVMAGSIVVPVLDVIRGDLDVSGTAAGLIITTHGLAIALSSPLTGWLVDQFGARTVLGFGLVVYGVFGAAGLVVSSYPLLIATRFLFGLGAATIVTSTTVATLAFYQGRRRDQVMGWTSTATGIGGLVWPLLGGALGGISWHATFGIYLIGVPLGVATLLRMPETRGADRADRPAGKAITLIRDYPALGGYLLLMLATGLLMYSLAVFLPTRLAEVGIRAPFLVSTFNVAASAVMSLVGLVYARIRARLRYAVLLRIAAALWVVAFLVLGTAAHPALIFSAVAVLGLANGLAFPALRLLIGEAVPPKRRGAATGMLGVAMFAGQFGSPLLLGPLVSATTTATGYLAAAGLSAAILISVSVIAIREPRPT